MKRIEKIEALREKFGDESIKTEGVFFPMWLTIELKEGRGQYELLRCSDKTTHNPLFGGPAYGLTVCVKTGKRKEVGQPGRPWYLSGAWKSALSLWPVKGEKEIAEAEQIMDRSIDSAYKKHCMK